MHVPWLVNVIGQNAKGQVQSLPNGFKRPKFDACIIGAGLLGAFDTKDIQRSLEHTEAIILVKFYTFLLYTFIW